MPKKLTNKELMQLTIDEESCKIINWIWKRKDDLKLFNCIHPQGAFTRKPAKEILEMYKKENNL